MIFFGTSYLFLIKDLKLENTLKRNIIILIFGDKHLSRFSSNNEQALPLDHQTTVLQYLIVDNKAKLKHRECV